MAFIFQDIPSALAWATPSDYSIRYLRGFYKGEVERRSQCCKELPPSDNSFIMERFIQSVEQSG
jgi:hypothetical protein